MKTILISTISHEIKTPLTGIRMILHLLRKKSASDDCERLLSTLNGLLDLSRMEAGRTQLDLLPTLPRELLERTQAAGRRVALATQAHDGCIGVQSLPHTSTRFHGEFPTT